MENIKNLSEFSSRKEWENYLWKEFLKRVNDKKLELFLNNLLTNQEKRNIIRRLATISLFKKGMNYRQIGEILWLSPNTISSIKKSIGNGEYKSYFEISKKNKNNNKPNKTSKHFLQFSFSDMADGMEDIINIMDEIFDRLLNVSGNGRWKFLNPTMPSKRKKLIN